MVLGRSFAALRMTDYWMTDYWMTDYWMTDYWMTNYWLLNCYSASTTSIFNRPTTCTTGRKLL